MPADDKKRGAGGDAEQHFGDQRLCQIRIDAPIAMLMACAAG